MVYSVRERCGKQLAHEAPVKADLVSTVPESATPAALGYAKEVWLGTISWAILYKILNDSRDHSLKNGKTAKWEEEEERQVLCSLLPFLSYPP